jgi:phage shock protein C
MSNHRADGNPHRLYRNREKAILAGVCAGLADYFGFCTRGLRVVVAISAIFFMPFVFVSYLVLAILLPVKPQEGKLDEDKEEFWRNVSNAPSDVFSNVSHRFRELDLRMQKMEAFVTSREFEIDRELARSSKPGDS